MLGKNVILASTALVASMALAACDTHDDPPVSPLEFGWLGLPVGEPVEVISATRGDGVSFGAFIVTLNADGSVTVETPEGETIEFSEADVEWAGSDPDLGGMNIAKLTSAGGDRLDVTVGSASVPPPPDVEAPDDVIDVVALSRLDENDTRHGFETYGVVGNEVDPANLPRYQYDVIIDGEGSAAAGELAQGSAWYSGEFMASVFEQGELLSEDLHGWAGVEIDFANNNVWIGLEGEYLYDDVDDVMEGNTVTGVLEYWGSFVASVDPSVATAIQGFDYDTGTFVTGITAQQATAITGFDPTTGEFVTDVGATLEEDVLLSQIVGYVEIGEIEIPIVGILNTDMVVAVNPDTGYAITALNPEEGNFLTALDVPSTGDAVTNVYVTDTGQFVTAVNAEMGSALIDITAQFVTDTDNVYQMELSGTGDAGDLGFDGGVQYTGTLDGGIEIPEKEDVWVNEEELAGEFAGSLFGPLPAALETVDPDNFDEVVDATATAGVFEGDNAGEEDVGDPQVQVVGGYIAEADDTEFNSYEPAPPPLEE